MESKSNSFLETQPLGALPVFFGLDGVLFFMPAADAMTFLIGAFIIRRTYRQLAQPA